MEQPVRCRTEDRLARLFLISGHLFLLNADISINSLIKYGRLDPPVLGRRAFCTLKQAGNHERMQKYEFKIIGVSAEKIYG